MRLRICILLAGAALLAGCANNPKAPTAQLAVSQEAVAGARKAEALQYAPVALNSAQQKLNDAQVAMQREDYDSARRLAEQAEVDAKVAETQSRSQKAQLAANELQESIRVLKNELDRVQTTPLEPRR